MRKDRGRRKKNWKIIQLCSRKKKKLISIFMYLLHKRFILKISSREQREKNLCDLKTCFDHFCKNFFFILRYSDFFTSSGLEKFNIFHYQNINIHIYECAKILKAICCALLVIPLLTYLLSHNNHAHWIKRASALALISCASFTRYYALLELFFCSWTL